MNYYDTRAELGLTGWIEYPERFYRDDQYHESNWFYNASLEEREALDIFFAEDTTIINNGQRKLSTFTATWDEILEKYLILFDVENIPIEEQKDDLMQKTDSQCSQVIHANWSANAQRNVSMGLYEQTTCEQCKTDISQMLIDNQTNLDAIEALETQEDIDNFTPTWSLE